MCKHWNVGLHHLITKFWELFFLNPDLVTEVTWPTQVDCILMILIRWTWVSSSCLFALALCQWSGSERVKREKSRVFVQGQGHSAGLERTELSPTRCRAALMKGYAARLPGYTGRGLIGLMRCSSSSARSGTGGRGRMAGPTGRYGSARGRGFIFP